MPTLLPFLHAIAAPLLLALAATGAQAASSFDKSSGGAGQAYPDKPIRLLLPFPVGGPSDITGRAAYAALSLKYTGRSVVGGRAGTW